MGYIDNSGAAGWAKIRISDGSLYGVQLLHSSKRYKRCLNTNYPYQVFSQEKKEERPTASPICLRFRLP